MDGRGTEGTGDHLGAGLRELVADIASGGRRDLGSAARNLRGETPAPDVERQCAEALARVHGASDVLKFTLRRIEELEARGRELAEMSARRIEDLEREVHAAETRADDEEDGARQAEEWLRRVHSAVVGRLQPPPAA
jgi:hypothetical protein